MLNQTVLVGRLVADVELKQTESGKNYADITLAIPRSFKDINGEYSTDFIDIRIFDSVATNTTEYCHKGDIVGVKGRLQSFTKENAKRKENVMQVVGEKVTFLSSRNDHLHDKSNKEQGDR